ncbi:unnamed protein product [Pseudo-nitzschia multistriata]|uniref:S1 motif domain-containing protein n=1 Tax=Pseudo-nitzschia multistriata TaxID=183589 RepID=A0A448ZMJ9_9STRA|nr:unnamed protein product [Pseudo-nitzschia multistriata]
MVDETSFPRGSSHSAKKIEPAETTSKELLRPSQKRKASGEKAGASQAAPTASSIEKDFLFGSKKTKEGKSSSSSKRRKTDDAPVANKHSLLPLGGGGVVVSTRKHKKENSGTTTVSTTTHIEALGFSKMAKGTKVLACVREVQEHYAIVSLPNLLTAYILPQGKPGQTPKYPLANTLRVGQTIAVVVTKIAVEPVKGGKPRRRIQVSALPQAVNPRLLLAGEIGGNTGSDLTSAANRLARAMVPIRGQILSVEDHGCVVELGFGKRGFLSFDQVGSSGKHKDNNYVILEEDEEYEDEEDDDVSKRPIILQQGRIYDFMVLPINTASDKEQSATTVFPLSLQTTQRMAKQTVSSLTSNASGKHGKGGSKKTTTVPFSFSSLTPGWLVQVKVEAIANNGLCVSLFGNVFRGAMEMNHLGATLIPNAKDGAAAGGPDGGFQRLADGLFQNHQHFTARILAVDVPTKLIRLSMAPHILTLAQPSEPKNPLRAFPTTGSIVRGCTVVKLDPGIGALLALPSEHNIAEDSLLPKSMAKSCDLFQNSAFEETSHIRKVYVHISKALDESEEAETDNDGSVKGKFLKEFAPSTQHDVRILSTGHWLEGIATGGCAPSILKAHVLTHADLVPGKVYKQVPICSHLQGGSILVQLGGGSSRSSKGKKKKSPSSSHQVSGLIPPAQLFDVVSKNSSEYRQKIFKTKYAVDAKVDVRVLWVDPIRKKCLVTAKKTIVQASQEQIITDYSDAKVGQIAVGFVSRVDDQGLSITFCNKVYGKVTARSLAADLGVEDHRETYSVGDVVTTRIVKVKKVTRKQSFEEDDEDSEMDGDDDVEMQSSGGREHFELVLSLKVHGGDDDDDAMNEDEVDIHNPQQVRLRAGAILPGKSMKIVELVNGKPKKSGGYVPGYAIVSIKSKHLVDGKSLGKAKMLSNIECKLPYNNLADSFEPVDILNVENLDALAKRVLTVGKKIKQQGLVLVDPQKSNVDYASGIGSMPVVSLRKKLIETIENQSNAKGADPEKVPIVPSPSTRLFVGAYLLGFVAQVDTRHGAFVRFLDGMTGLVPKKSGGLQLHLYDTLVTKIAVIDDSVVPHRIMLETVSGSDHIASIDTKKINTSFKVGDKISKAKLTNIHFLEASLRTGPNKESVYLHCSDKDSKLSVIKERKKPLRKQSPDVTKNHPFYNLKAGKELQDLTVLSIQTSGNKVKVWVTDKKIDSEKSDAPLFIEKASDLSQGMKITGIVTAFAKDNNGIFVQISPKLRGFVSGLELSRDTNVLNDLESHVPLGAAIECRVIKVQSKGASKDPFIMLSVLACETKSAQIPKPVAGDLVIGRINKDMKSVLAPSLMLNLRGAVGRCCITELEEPDEWVNMPLGQPKKEKSDDDDAMDEGDGDGENTEVEDDYVNKEYVECRVLGKDSSGKHVDVSLRSSRISGDLEDDPAPTTGDVVQGYVLQTTNKGCFVRISRTAEGRSTLRELCDGYIANPTASFPMGRLVVGKIKETRPVSKKGRHSKDSVKIQADLDMRESVLLEEAENLLSYEDIEEGKKYKGTVQTVTNYGVFVRIERSNMDGLVHLSECSDKFVKDLEALYSPGDLVKVLVVKKDDEAKRLGLSMKASHFEDDSDTDDSSVDSDIEMQDSDDESDDMENVRELQDSDDGSDSDDENYAAKLAAKMNDEDDDGSDDDGSGSEDDSEDEGDGSDDSSSDDESDDDEKDVLDTNVGFSWGAAALGSNSSGAGAKEGDSSDDSDSDSDSDDDEGEFGNEKSNSRRSRKRQAKKRLEEQETSRRETALADGTADSNPETAGDFERLLSGEPNNSELWIRYMAFHLSLADVPAARKVAETALERIEFREEKEKLNVWSALLTLEHKFGNDETFQGVIDRACQQNNPKQVYMRACEILANDAEQSSNDPVSVKKADALFATMCKKHKSKKTVWLAHMRYLLKQSRDKDAHALMKRAMMSLGSHKHAETMSRFAQMEFELGSPERGRTIFDGLLLKYAKRLDLFFVYLDKECKFGNLEHARSMLERKVEERKLSDRQMKSLFKKWYRMEEEHGTEETQEHVKESARAYVTTSTK